MGMYIDNTDPLGHPGAPSARDALLSACGGALDLRPHGLVSTRMGLDTLSMQKRVKKVKQRVSKALGVTTAS